jgi:excisionase family DNA binding protein
MPQRKPQRVTPPRPVAVTHQHAADQLQVTTRQIRRMVIAGKLKAIETGKRGSGIAQASIDALVNPPAA